MRSLLSFRRPGGPVRLVWVAAMAAGVVLVQGCAEPRVSASASVPGASVRISVAPPALPSYDQPPIPGDGYLWTPGYWAWGASDYYWVPGTWVLPPAAGLLWTPGYWGFNDGVYLFHDGYWGAHVGFYGGVSYGFGYDGIGFQGGYWRDGGFAYNRAVVNVGTTVVHNTYVQNTTVNVTRNTTNVSYNGGPGGTQAAPTAEQRQAAREPHTPPTSEQREHTRQAMRRPELAAQANHGRPAVAAIPRPGHEAEAGAVSAHSFGHAPATPAAMPAREFEAPRGEPRPEPRVEREPEPARGVEPAQRPQERPRGRDERREDERDRRE